MAAKRFTVDINGTKELVQTFTVWAGDGAAGNTVRIPVVPGAKVELVDSQTRTGPKAIKAKRVGDDLHVALPGSDASKPDVVLEDYYAKGGRPGHLIGRGAKGQYFNYGTLSSVLLAEHAEVTGTLGGKSVTPWGDVAPGSVPPVMSAERAGQVAAVQGAEALTIAPAAGLLPGSGTVVAMAPAPALGAAVGGTTASGAAASGGLGTLGWVLGAVGLGGIGAAAGGGGDGGTPAPSQSPAPAPSPAPSPAPAPSPGVPVLSIAGPASVDESSGTATFTVSLSAASTQTVSVQLATANGTATAGADYTAKTGTVTIPAGQTSATFSVALLGDVIDEAAAETFTVTLSNPVGATLGVVTSTTTSIADNDAAPTISISPATSTVNEANFTIGYTVSLSAASAQTITVNVATAPASSGATATAGSDFTAKSETLTFAPGVTTQALSVAVLDDARLEGTEAFSVNLSAPSNATLAIGAATVTIADNEVQTVSSVAGNGNQITEGATATFTVRLSAASDGPQQHTLALSGSLSAAEREAPSFTNGVTYNAATGRLSVPGGVDRFDVSIKTLEDTAFELTETLTVTVGARSDSLNVRSNDSVFGSAPVDTALADSSTRSALVQSVSTDTLDTMVWVAQDPVSGSAVYLSLPPAAQSDIATSSIGVDPVSFSPASSFADLVATDTSLPPVAGV